MSKRRELSYAVRLAVVLKYWGQLILVSAVLTTLPLVVSAAYGEFDLAGRYVAIVAVMTAGGLLLARIRAPRHMQKNEALVVVALIFLTTPLLMSWPMMLSGATFVDAFFESVSGVTTTGLTTLPGVEGKSEAFLFARAWMQWYGGLGVMALALAIVVQPGVMARRLSISEERAHDPIGSTRAHFRRIATLYLLLTAVGLGLLVILGVGPLRAVQYVFASVSTGGFAPDDASLASFQSAAPVVVITLLCVVASISLASYHDIVRRGPRRIFASPQLVALVVLILLQAALLSLSMRYLSDFSWSEIALHAPVMAASAQSTSGFSTLDVQGLDPVSKSVMMVSMFVGGGAGSTAGGIKLLRLLIVLALIHSLLVRTAMPSRTVMKPRLGRSSVDDAEVRTAVAVIGLACALVFGSWLVFLAWGYAPMDALFEVISATATVGLSAGITGPDLPALLKLVLCADMLAGRLEIVAWVVLFYPRTWIGRRRHEADLDVGHPPSRRHS